MKHIVSTLALSLALAAFTVTAARAQLNPSPQSAPTPLATAIEGSSPTLAQDAWESKGGKEFFGSEIEDSPTGGIFASVEAVKRLLGEPEYVYMPTGLTNPMVVPWRRQQVLGYELLDTVEELVAKGQWKTAAEILNRIIQEMPNTEVARIAERQLADVMKAIERIDRPQATPSPESPTEYKELPVALVENVRGIVWSQTPKILVGESIIEEGQTVPEFEDVTVREIEKKKVVFFYDRRLHEVEVDASRPDQFEDSQFGIRPASEKPQKKNFWF